MPSIIIHYDPSGASKRDTCDVPAGTMISEWVMDKWPDGSSAPMSIYHGLVSPENLIVSIPWDHDREAPDHVIGPHDVIHIVRQPMDPVTAIIIGVSLIVGIGSAFLLAPAVPVPDNPSFETAQESPNNSLSGQTNIARPLQRIPDLYGRNRIYPDLITPSYSEFINHVKFVTEYMCVGRGEFLVEDIKSGDTLINDIEGSSATVFEPDDRPNPLLIVEAANEVNGQEIAAPNDGAEFNIDASGVTFGGPGFGDIRSGDSSMSQFASMSPGTTITVSGTTSNNGNLTFQSYGFDNEEELVFFINVTESVTPEGPVSANFTSTSGKASSYGPFVVPGEPDEIWIDIIAPNGLQELNGIDKNTVDVEFTAAIQEIDSVGDPVGSVQNKTLTIQGNTLSARFYTFKIDDLTNPGERHEVTLTRNTNTVNDSTIQYHDLTKWSRLAGVVELSTVDFPDFGNVTTVLVKTRATEQATRIQQREFNAVVTRKLRTFDTGTGLIVPALSATAKMADAALEHLTDTFLGNQSITNIDLDELYEIQGRLDTDAIYGDNLGRFSYSLSDAKASVEDELQTILNAARTLFFQEGSVFQFVRDEIRETRVALFNTRIKKPGGESKTIEFFKAGDQDGVEIRWVDEQTGDASTILLPSPVGGLNNLRINAAGIKNFKQAWNRGTYEFEKLKRQRENVSTTVGGEGILPRINDRVANVDGTNIEAQGGEIIAAAGLIVETDSEVVFGASLTGTVLLRGPNGDVSAPLDCEPRSDALTGFVLTESPSFTVFTRGEPGVQVGTIYSFFAGPDDDHNVNDYLIGKMSPSGDGETNLVLVKYVPEIYDADTTEPPA